MAFPTTGILDNFNRANEGPPPSANWSSFNADDAGKVSSSAWICNTGLVNSSNYWNTTTFGADSEAYITVTTKPASTVAMNVGVRLVDAGLGMALGVNGYLVRLVPDAGADVVTLRRWAGGSSTLLGTFSQEFSAGDGLGISAVGNILTAWYKESGGSWVSLGTYDITGDATKYTDGGYIGFTSNLDASVVLDDFGGGTYVPSEEQGIGVAGGQFRWKRRQGYAMQMDMFW